MSQSFFKLNPTHWQAQPGLQRAAVWLWLTGQYGLAWMRDPNAPRPTWPQKLWALAWAWLLFGGFFLVVAFIGVYFLWYVARIGMLTLAIVLTAVYLLTRVQHAATTRRGDGGGKTT